MSSNSNADDLWEKFCEAEDAFYAARMALFKSGADLGPLIATALADPSRRHTGLRLLEIQPEVASRRHIAQLVTLASFLDRNMELVRALLSRVDRTWLLGCIESHVAPLLPGADDHTYRRIAELYVTLGANDLLAQHIERCAQHPSPHVREIAEDFGSHQEPPHS